jgi:peptidylprolyl isomerase
MKKFTKVQILAAVFLAAAGLASCQPKADRPDGLYAIMETNKGNIVISLEFEKAPLTVGNFVGLAEGKLDATKGKHFYDGIVFHRVEPGFVVQGGDPLGNGTGGPGYRFPDEFSPELKHDAAGVVSMANSGSNTNGSQFFITLAAAAWLDGKHSVFGKVVEGMDVVNSLKVGDKIQKVEIERYGQAAKAFDSSQKAWDERLGAAYAALKATSASKAEDNKKIIASKWPDAVADENGIYQKVLRNGVGDVPAKGSTVSVIYKGMLLDGTVFDQSALAGGPLKFKVGSGEIIEGWDKVVSTMHKGEKRLVVIPPELAYGSAGIGGVIPADAYLVFEMELVSISK